MGRMIKENEAALQDAIARDFKTASQEYIFETTRHRARDRISEEPARNMDDAIGSASAQGARPNRPQGHGLSRPLWVVLVIGPFNGPLLLLLRPAITALAAGNTCILKLSDRLSATSAVLLDLVPKYFDPRAVAAVAGNREGRDGYNMLTHAKAMLISTPDVAIDHLFPPYTDEKNRELATWFDY